MSSPELRLERDGCKLAYKIRGEGPPVVFIQGVGVHGDGWKPQVDALEKAHRCLTFDNRGMGKSQPCEGALSVEQMADDALALMDAAGFEKAHVVGHSLGGLIALALALRAKQRVLSLALLCTFADGRDAGPPTPRLMAIGARTRIGTKGMRRRAFLELIVPPEMLATVDRDVFAAQLEPLFGHDLGELPKIVDRQLEALRDFDATPRLGQLASIKTLVVAAEHDLIAPPSVGRKIAAGLPGSRFVELDGAAHGVPLHSPERVNALLREHFAAR